MKLVKLTLKLGSYFRKDLASILRDRNDKFDVYAGLWGFHAPDPVFYGALRFITSCKALSHPHSLYAWAGRPVLSTCRQNHWYIFIYKVGSWFLKTHDAAAGSYSLRFPRLIIGSQFPK